MIRPTMSHAVNKDEFHRLMSDYATHLEGQLAKANERVKELEGFADAFLQLKGEEVVCSYCGKSELCKDFDIFNGGTVNGLLNKFAIDKQIEALQKCIMDNSFENKTIDAVVIYVDDVMADIEQLRKEQSSE